MAKKPLEIDMIAGSQLRDIQGEMLDVSGADITELQQGNGRFNDNHQSGFFNSVGRVTFAKKIFKEEDCDDERQKYYWEKVKSPYIYVKGLLYDDEDHPNARAAAAILRNIHKADIPLKLKASVEGATVARGLRDPSLLARTKIHSVALTFTPANNATLVEPISLDKNIDVVQTATDYALIRSVVHLAKTDVPSFRHITRHASANKISDKIKEINELSSQLGLPAVVHKTNADNLVKNALESKIVNNINKIKELVGQLTKARPNPFKHGFYDINEKGSESKYTDEDALNAKMRALKTATEGVAERGEAVKNRKNIETGKTEPHILVHRGLQSAPTTNPKFNQIDVKNDHVVQPTNAVHTLDPAAAHTYSKGGGVYSFWVPISNVNAMAAYHNAGALNPHNEVPKDKLSYKETYSPDSDEKGPIKEGGGWTSKRIKIPEKKARELLAHEDWPRRQHHISVSPGKFQRATEDELHELNHSMQQHLDFKEKNKNSKTAPSMLANHNFKFPKKSLDKALTAGAGGGGAPGSLTGGSVIQAESVDHGFKYITCHHCGKDQPYLKHQVKCRNCSKSLSFEKLESHFKPTK